MTRGSPSALIERLRRYPGPGPRLRHATGDRAPGPGPWGRRGARHRRPLGLRQVDAAGARRRPARAGRRHDRGRGARPPAERLARCAYMPQRDLLLPWLSAIDNAALALRNRGASRGRGTRGRPPPVRALRARRASSARAPRELSGGMRQRVAFLRTLLAGKPVLLLDEPFASLDAITRAEMQEWLARRWRAEPRHRVLVTHDVEEALYLSDRVTVLSARPGKPARRARRAAPALPAAPDAVTSPGFTSARERALAALSGRDRDEALAAAAGDRRRPARHSGSWRRASGCSPTRSSSSPSSSPPPSQIAESLWQDRALLAENAWVTLQEVLAGFALSVIAGLGFAVVLHLSPTLRRAFYPLLVASQTVPIVVVAPILVVWLGFGIGPKLAIIALICFFPITVNTLDGLGSVDPDLVKMMRTLDADRWQTLRRVEAPTALPYFFSGAKIAVAVAVIGAVFGEWAGSSSGLGHLIQQASAQLQTARFVRRRRGALGDRDRSVRVARPLERRVAWWGPNGTRVSQTPEEISPEGAARGTALALSVAALAAGCGEKSEDVTPGDPAALRRRARLLRERRPRRALHGDRARLLPRRRPRRPPACPLGSLGADQGGRRRPGGPGDLIRARGASGPRPGPAGEGRRRRGADAAHLPDLAPGLRDRQGQGPARQDGRHGRHPLPGGLPGDDPRALRPDHRRRRRRQRPAGASCRRSSPGAPTRCSAAS